MIAQLEPLDAHDVAELRVQGQVDVAGLQRLQEAIGRAEARARHLQADLSALRLVPTDEDIAGLQADGYLGEVVQELREAQTSADPHEARVAQDAMALLAAELVQRAPAVVPKEEGARP